MWIWLDDRKTHQTYFRGPPLPLGIVLTPQCVVKLSQMWLHPTFSSIFSSPLFHSEPKSYQMIHYLNTPWTFLSLCLGSHWPRSLELSSNISIKSTVYPLRSSSNVVSYSSSMPFPPPPLPWIILLVLKLILDRFFLLSQIVGFLMVGTTCQPFFGTQCQLCPSEHLE